MKKQKKDKKYHHIVANLSVSAVCYNEWSLSNARWMKIYNSHGKYKHKLNEYFLM